LARVVGIGGIFVKSENPARLYEWYEENLGIAREPGETFAFSWDDLTGSGRKGYMVCSFFPKHTKYFEPSKSAFMINFCVDDLAGMIARLGGRGIEVQGPEEYDYGRFAWVMDPDGNRIELWEPPKAS
jgi:predicted enzyme related to lactoylglutathione lyase